MRIGIIGAGQLGQMLGFAARDMGVECVFLDPSENPPAAACGNVLRYAFDDAKALEKLAEQCDVVTYEFENVPVDALQIISGRAPVFPPAAALRHAQDRLDEKKLFERLKIPLANYHTIDTRQDLYDAAVTLALPMIVKTRRLGYDGKGQYVVRDRRDLDTAWNTLGGQALIAEQWIAFEYEVSCIGVRNVGGDRAIYPLSHNVHSNGILRTSTSPVDAPAMSKKAAEYVHRLLEQLDYVGVLALELFVVGDELLANEFAPRVHNSGHWTIEGAETSQFENHLRALLNLPLGATAGRAQAGMVNLIGEIPDAIRSLGFGRLHDYGKSARTGRKLGHITVVAETARKRDNLVEKIDTIVTQSDKVNENLA